MTKIRLTAADDLLNYNESFRRDKNYLARIKINNYHTKLERNVCSSDILKLK